VILVAVMAAVIGFCLGFRVSPLLRKNPALTPPVISHREVQQLRDTALALEAKVEQLEHQVKGPKSRQNS
jgi:hypothetical protein